MSSESSPCFRSLPAQVDLPALEREVLDRWRDGKVFERSLEQNAAGPSWVFYEGPPTANGMPGVHHIEARVFKDVFPRYKSMRGYHVPARRAGTATACRSRSRSKKNWACPASPRSRRTASPSSTPSAASRCCGTSTRSRR